MDEALEPPRSRGSPSGLLEQSGAQGIHPRTGRGAWLSSEDVAASRFSRRWAVALVRQRRRPAPPSGWYLPAVASHVVELDAFDTIEGLRLKGGKEVEVRTAYLPPRRAARRLAGRALHRAAGRERPPRALAGPRPARLRPVRQRQHLPWHPRLPRPHRAREPAVPRPRGRARLRAAPRDRLPGRGREPQRALAGQALATHVQRDAPGPSWTSRAPTSRPHGPARPPASRQLPRDGRCLAPGASSDERARRPGHLTSAGPTSRAGRACSVIALRGRPPLAAPARPAPRSTSAPASSRSTRSTPRARGPAAPPRDRAPHPAPRPESLTRR